MSDRPAGDGIVPGELEFTARQLDDGQLSRVTIRHGIVSEVIPLDGPPGDTYVGPGWIDIQINGYGGHDPNSTDVAPETVAAMVRALWSQGIAGSCITITTESEEHMLRSMRAVADACAADPQIGASVLGIHVEGPHIGPEDGPRGAHPLRFVRPPDIDEYHRWQLAADGRIKIVTLSPEYQESIPYIRTIVREGVVASIGHTAATADQLAAAVDAGATCSTHLGNGSHAMLPRHPNYIWDQLAEDRLDASFIFDGQHLPPSLMRTMIRAKGIERSILVSDAVAFAGLPPGAYQLFGDAMVDLTPSGRLELRGTPYLAGSVATLPVCLSNAMKHCGLSLGEAVTTVTANPARLLDLPGPARLNPLKPGNQADLTVFRYRDETFEVEPMMTVIGGQVVFADSPT